MTGTERCKLTLDFLFRRGEIGATSAFSDLLLMFQSRELEPLQDSNVDDFSISAAFLGDTGD